MSEMVPEELSDGGLGTFETFDFTWPSWGAWGPRTNATTTHHVWLHWLWAPNDPQKGPEASKRVTKGSPREGVASVFVSIWQGHFHQK